MLTAETVFESISDEKKTAMGNGFFVTWVTIYRDQDGEVVGPSTVPHAAIQDWGAERLD